jgi:hypothetical protein
MQRVTLKRPPASRLALNEHIEEDGERVSPLRSGERPRWMLGGCALPVPLQGPSAAVMHCQFMMRGWGTCVMNATMRGDASGLVRCPGCDAPMRLMRREPLLFSNSLMDVTYRCDACEMLTQQTVKRDEPSGPLGIT